MESFSIVMIVLIALVVFTVFKGVRIVPQGYKWVVQRLGKYSQTLEPGLNLIIPYVDDVAYKVTTKDIVLDIPSQEVITRDAPIKRFMVSKIMNTVFEIWYRRLCVQLLVRWI